MRAKSIMIQGTASSVGKSLIAAGLCRIFRQDGYRVAPFKSQNMALNSYITTEGLEMGRAQVVQAEAAGVEPEVCMNPILLKPTSDKKAQVIIDGRVYGNMSAVEYHDFKPQLKGLVKNAYDRLASRYDIIVIEGAGSPAEINLRERDIVNMGMAELADAPVLLVGDIDRGGVFASLAGTMLLLSEEEKRRVSGVIINKFRGDIGILKPGLDMLEDIIRVPVLGVVPYARLAIDEEDSVSEKLTAKGREGSAEIDIAVIRLPHISNYTDFNALENIGGAGVRYAEDLPGLGKPDMVILPGTKNTVEDMLFLRSSGLERAILELNEKGVPVFGICGGYQMLGREIRDPGGVESGLGKVAGMGLLDATTVIGKEKRAVRAEAEILGGAGIFQGMEGLKVRGYEIHMGMTSIGGDCRPFSRLSASGSSRAAQEDGACGPAGTAAGTYIHGIFDNGEFTLKIINNLRRRKGLGPLKERPADYQAFKQGEYDRLARLLREHLDMERVYESVRGGKDVTA